MNVKVEAISEWELLKGYNAEWIDTTTNITADLPVGTLATVKPQEKNPYDKERRGTLVFRNVQRPSIMQTLIVTQKAGAATTVNIGKLYRNRSRQHRHHTGMVARRRPYRLYLDQHHRRPGTEQTV